MATQAYAPPRRRTIADLLHDLGDIPAERILLDPPPGTATEQDVIDLDDHEDRLVELVDGVLVEKPMGYYESRLAIVLGRILDAYAEAHDLGIVAGEAGMMKFAKGLVRIPDISFVSWDRLPNREIPREPIPFLAPDLAVEILSKSNTNREMERKLREYFAAGTRAVWLVDPKKRTLAAYSSPEEHVEIPSDGAVDGGDVLPGFILSLAELFARVDGKAKT